MTERWVVDTSVAIPMLVASHQAHGSVLAWAHGRALGLCGHALVETYSVLTRLPGDARVSLEDAVRLIDENFDEQATLSREEASQAHHALASLGIAGGAVYDGLIALAAREQGAVLVTRDARARATYETVGVSIELIR